MKRNIQCIFCPYKKEEDCVFNHEKCYSLSNIYHGTICKFFPFNLINKLSIKYKWWKYERDCIKAEKKYGDYALENDDFKFIWGVKSCMDFSELDASMFTMNDIDITYDKKKNVYMLGIETAYMFDDGYEGECKYLKECLNAFTKYMDDNKLNKNENYGLFMNNTCTSTEAKSIEELYTNFRIFVNGYCSLKE